MHKARSDYNYADDVILYSDICSAEGYCVLQNDFDLLAQWSTSYKRQMMFNPKKCEFLRISNKTNIIPTI